MQKQHNGTFVVSLDFEMFWGIADFASYAENEQRIKKVHAVVPRLLALFETYGIHATWATVGALMTENAEAFLKGLPAPLAPQTKRTLFRMGLLAEQQAYQCPKDIIFAPELVQMVADTSNQEIGTHTYSHYYCDIPVSSPQEFRGELRSAAKAAECYGRVIRSIVFPRNQVGRDYVSTAIEEGVPIYRGVEKSWLNRLKGKHPRLWRVLWYLDNYLPIHPRYSYAMREISDGTGFNVRNSRFFKPYKAKYAYLEGLKVRRYCGEIRRAAKHGEVYHIYLHPHNFAENTEINFGQFERLLKCFRSMQERYGMRSMTMQEAADCCRDENDQEDNKNA